MNASSNVARHTRSYEAILARLASTTPATGYSTVLAAHLHKHAHRAGIDLTTDASLEDLVRPVRIRAQGLDEALARSTDLISERTRVLVEPVSATAWAGHVAPDLLGREQLLAAIAGSATLSSAGALPSAIRRPSDTVRHTSTMAAADIVTLASRESARRSVTRYRELRWALVAPRMQLSAVSPPPNSSRMSVGLMRRRPLVHCGPRWTKCGWRRRATA